VPRAGQRFEGYVRRQQSADVGREAAYQQHEADLRADVDPAGEAGLRLF
jgi:hypothetical protein